MKEQIIQIDFNSFFVNNKDYDKMLNYALRGDDLQKYIKELYWDVREMSVNYKKYYFLQSEYAMMKHFKDCCKCEIIGAELLNSNDSRLTLWQIKGIIAKTARKYKEYCIEQVDAEVSAIIM